MSSFVTGSQAYGTLHPESDIDLVVQISPEDIARLQDSGLADKTRLDDPDYTDADVSFKFGKLNLICVSDPELFSAWKAGTEELKKRAPVTRDEAVALLKHYCRS